MDSPSPVWPEIVAGTACHILVIFTAALTKLNPITDDKEMLSTWGENLRYGAVAAVDQDYDVVRRMKCSSPIPNANKEQ